MKDIPISGAYVVDTDGPNDHPERNPPDCSWCFGQSTDREDCTCTDCPKSFCNQRASACYDAFSESLFRAIDITVRRSELRDCDENSQRYYAQACCGHVLQWIDHYTDVIIAQKTELIKRGE